MIKQELEEKIKNKESVYLVYREKHNAPMKIMECLPIRLIADIGVDIGGLIVEINAILTTRLEAQHFIDNSNVTRTEKMTTNKDWEDYINEGYEKCDEQEYTMQELGLNNYGDDIYYFNHRNEFEKDLKIVELEEENLRLKEQLKNAIVPKFKIGQNIYRIKNGNIVKNFIQNIMVAYYKNNTTLITYFLSESTSGCVLKEQNLFATKEEAEKKLKELKGEE